jgi:hypothetical protein
MSGANLSTNVTVTAPSGFEVSTSSGSGFASSVTVAPSSGTVGSTTIYVRLKSNASPGANSGNMTVASTGATSQNVAVSGTVNIPSMTMNVSSSAGSLNGDYGATKLFADEVAGVAEADAEGQGEASGAEEGRAWVGLQRQTNGCTEGDGVPDAKDAANANEL